MSTEKDDFDQAPWTLRSMFCHAISAYSEEHWCAVWYVDVVDHLRRAGGQHLVETAARCGGWPYWGDDTMEWRWLTVEETLSLRHPVEDYGVGYCIACFAGDGDARCLACGLSTGIGCNCPAPVIGPCCQVREP